MTQIYIEPLNILSQPNDTSCGPTCLHAIYHFYGLDIDINKIIAEIPELETGGTLAVMLGNHALAKGYQANIYTFNLQIFDPTWFQQKKIDLAAKIRQQMQYKQNPKLQLASKQYLNFLSLGGKILFKDLTSKILHFYLDQSIPILTGLSATYLYQSMREYGKKCDYDDIRGEPQGHFVILYGYDKVKKKVLIADPLKNNPFGKGNYYSVKINRLMHAIMLGIITYDANLLIIEPKKSPLELQSEL